MGLLVVAPFVAFVAVFLVYPTVIVLFKAVTPGGSLGVEALQRALSGTYRTGFINSIALAGTSAVIGGTIGILLALTVRSLQRPRWLRPTLDSWSAVASQLGGVPLAFAFIATIGAQGVLTRLLKGIGIDASDYGISPTGFWGLVFVYLYFQIPLMFLVMLPAVNGLRSTWREAASVLGASGLRYWRSVGVPILAPAALGGALLLFVNAFTAYATAYVLNPSGALVPLQIRFVLQGNVISGEQDLGNAIVAWVIVLLLASLVAMTLLQRRTLMWTKS
ncbi:MAG: ABC transporter permease subunit [Actinobacteria bacterium]|jgi:putative spermidine/putrescine transport system permease protein|nr:ABC transporter permease subunit [Actinomycetota bacterium]